jgi:purine catabolism regulator
MTKPRTDGVTIGDVIRLALPLSTTVTSGSDYRLRQVNWVIFAISWKQVVEEAQPGDLVLVPAALTEVPEARVREHLEKLVSRNIAGLVTFGNLPSAVIKLARERDLIILVIPSQTSTREMHQSISALIVDRQRQTTERGMQLYRRLSEMSREGQGLRAMTEIMSQLTGKIVVVQDKRLDIQAISQPINSPGDHDALINLLTNRDHLPSQLRNRKAAAKANQNHWQQVFPLDGNSEQQLGRLISPIVSGDRARGYVSVVGLADELDLLDTLTVEHGAAACALEMAKAKAISEAKKGLRGDFLEGLLAGNLPEEEISRLTSRLDHDTTRPHAILTLAWAGDDTAPSLRRLETSLNWVLTSHNRPVLVHLYGGNHICVFQGLADNDSEDMGSALELLRRLREQIEAEFPNARLITGMSGPAATIEEWPTVYRQAAQAMRLAARLNLDHVVDYNSLGIYQLLTKLENIPAVQAFCDEVIGPLADYDQKHRSSLVQTLEAYFDHHANISQTAESLFIHRNTLLYRLERIQELTGQNLNKADMRLAMHLSLKFWQLRPKNRDQVQ